MKRLYINLVIEIVYFLLSILDLQVLKFTKFLQNRRLIGKNTIGTVSFILI